MDVAIQSRIPTHQGSVDLTNCFDRMSHGYTSLNIQQKGISKNAAKLRFQTVQQLQVNVCTAHGDSTLKSTDEQFENDPAKPFQGNLQGMTDSMDFWTGTNAEIFNAMKDLGHGVKYLCAIPGDNVSFLGFHFVDDSNQPIHVPDGDLFDLMLKAQDYMDDCNGFVKATGKAINTKKKFYWLIDFKWQNG